MNERLLPSALAGTAIALAAQGAHADFSGPYAPANWTFISNGGDGSFTNNGQTLVLTGSDSWTGQQIATDYIITAAASGTWSFGWHFFSTDTGPFDSGGYLINGDYTVLAFNQGGSGSVSVPVNAGDVIGYRAWTEDDGLGAGILTITNFNAPVPGPGGLAALVVGGLLGAGPRRVRRTTS